MCGLAGVWYSDRTRIIDDAILLRMQQAIRHRGPDDAGCLNLGNTGVVHTRLSIVDTSEAGHQPFTDGRHVLAYNGEIYNHEALRPRLQREGVAFVGHSDTETLFHALVRWGVGDTLRVIRGMFAFSFIDLEERRLWLCRDRLGIKPLFWHAFDGGIAWASEIKAIAGMFAIRPDPARTLFAIAGIADHSNVYTVFEKVEHVPPGSIVEWREGGRPVTREYHSILHDIDPERYHAYASMRATDLEAEFTRLLINSVQRMRMSDVPMGVFISGGVDSSLIAAHAVVQDPEISLFTANIIGPMTEFSDARRIAAHLNRPLHDAPFEPQMLLEHWARCTWHYEAPIVTHVSAMPFARVAALARSYRVKAVLTGEGPDELLLGYPRILTRSILEGIRTRIPTLGRLFEFLKLLPGGLRAQAANAEGFHGLLIQRFERQVLRDEGQAAISFLPPGERVMQYYTIQMIREHLLSLLYRNDRMGMQEGIESRFPFLDEELVAFALHLPLRMKHGVSLRVHDRKHPFLVDKRILRQSAARVLPKETAYKKKNGFPMHGHKSAFVREGFFADGYVSEILGLDRRSLRYMHETQAAYHIAKLASVDIFGRLYAMGKSVEEVTAHVWHNAEIRVKPHPPTT